MNKIHVSIVGLFMLYSLVSCNEKAPTITNYGIDNNGNLIAYYDDQSFQIIGDFRDELVNGVESININDEGYFTINGIPTNINFDLLSEIFSVEISSDGFYVINGKKTDIKATEAWTVTFDTGFSETINSQSILDGDKVIRPDINREGYSLVGWFCNGEEWRFNSDVVLNNMTLTAKWKPNTYNVSFNTNEEFAIDDLTVEYDSSYELPVISKKGYTFLGWAFNGKIVQDEVWSIASDVVLSAEWSRNVYKISFDTQGGRTNRFAQG